ncbi:MAG: 9-O-acetylesterase, partial [Verrucomicrobiales bacterium]|nr:9-O-acetylesterase [Verrucomicrobiales bacterium]
MNRFVLFSLSLLLLASGGIASAGLKLPAMIGHHMVLQRDIENPIWGWADPGADVKVVMEGQTLQAKADEKGKWVVKLAPMKGSHYAMRMTIQSGGEQIVLSNIVVGEVWVCSGQSNMQFAVDQAYDADLEVATANYPNIRLITVPQTGTQEVQDDFKGQWDMCTPETVGQFSAVGYYFGRQLHETLGVPIGLIDNSWGGSAAEAWVARDVL